MLTIQFKPGVNCRALKPQILAALFDAAEVYDDRGMVLVVTSGNDGRHMDGSKHYENLAIDIRTQHLGLTPGQKLEIRDAIKAKVGWDYDVLLEGLGQTHEHIHIEYDPKG